MKNIFPDSITAHVLTLRDGSKQTLLVSPSETYGKALKRAGLSDAEVSVITLTNSPLSYEPDSAIASR